MKKENVKYIIILILIVFVVLIVVIKNEYLNSRNIIYNNVRKQEKENNLLAIFVSYDKGVNYSTYQSSNWLDDEYVFKQAKCTDLNNNVVDNVITFNNDTRKVMLRTNRAIKCYLYFDYSLINKLQKNDKYNALSEDSIGGMYRYQGVDIQYKDSETNSENLPVVDNNYICFGTNDKAKCLKDLNHYMYRIIGYDVDTGELKIIKKEAINKSYQWAASYDIDTPWPDSLIFKAINGNGFLDDNVYVPTNDKGINWQQIISDHNYLYGRISENDAAQNGLEIYKIESGQNVAHWEEQVVENSPGSIKTTVQDNRSPNYNKTVFYISKEGFWTDKIKSKISIMYLSDYVLSVSNTANCSYRSGKYAICKAGWLYLTNNDANPPASHTLEYPLDYGGFMHAYGLHTAFRIYKDGDLSRWFITDRDNIRPTFYLKNNIYLTGVGTMDDPYIINLTVNN